MKRSDRIKMIDGDEYDLLTRWRQFLSPSTKHLKWVKTKYNKRLRKQAKEKTNEEAR